jgi:hypothetical protein
MNGPPDLQPLVDSQKYGVQCTEAVSRYMSMYIGGVLFCNVVLARVLLCHVVVTVISIITNDKWLSA